MYIEADVYTRFTVPRSQAEATVNRVLTDNEMCNQLVSWAAGLEMRPLKHAHWLFSNSQ